MTRKIDRSVLLKARQLHPNPWNPYANKPDRLQQAIGESIGEFSQIQDVVCRPHPEIEGEYQILDGEGRHRTFKPDEDIYAIVLHGLTDDQAKKVTIVMDETRAVADKIQLSALLAELSENQSVEDLMVGLPYQESELSDLINSSAMDWDDDRNAEEIAEVSWDDAAGKIPEGDREPFQHMTFTLHDDQADVVKDALKQAINSGEFFEVNQNSNGNALHRICVEYLNANS